MEMAEAIANPYWMPQSVPQLMALLCSATILGYGGAAGGGKTDLILGKAVTHHTKSLVMRREATQLNGLVERSTEIIGDTGRYNGSSHIWKLKNGKRIRFGGLPKAGDWIKYQGQANDFQGYDEAANFLEMQIKTLIGWLRTTDKNQPCQAVLGFNPPTTAEGMWLIEFFGPWLDSGHHNPAQPGEFRYFATIDGKEQEFLTPDPIELKRDNGTTRIIIPKSRTFIPARVEDNQYLMDTGYADTLEMLPEPLRSMMRDGNFQAGMEDDIWQVIPTEWVKIAQARWEPDPPSDVEMDTVGCDPARGGRDETVLSPRYGAYFADQLCYPGTATPNGPAVAGLAVAAAEDGATIAVDVIGVGASVFDHLEDMKISTVAMHASEVSDSDGETDRSGMLSFVNNRSYWHWRMREALDPKKGDRLALPPCRKLLADLTAPRWKLVGKKIQVESKDDIKERIGRSPDKGDAAIYAYNSKKIAKKSKPKPQQAKLPYKSGRY